ncbi:hypothetical protein HPB47_022826 [Ixodes persulcatus]|uniref:Uncharacterized protein n=1 Tax=Ixodes persulcatus TaxID=34615 RepID=A0AC60Q9F0_IXOPE|nr:hypothetical protein HPB47_022826 [Ixodes persulcatus]
MPSLRSSTSDPQVTALCGRIVIHPDVGQSANGCSCPFSSRGHETGTPPGMTVSRRVAPINSVSTLGWTAADATSPSSQSSAANVTSLHRPRRPRDIVSD